MRTGTKQAASTGITLRRALRKAPAALVGLRLLMGPVLISGAVLHVPGAWLAVGLIAGLFSDIWDGVIARKLGVVDARLRSADSLADTIFIASTAVILGLRSGQALVAYAGPILGVAALCLAALVFDLARYGKAASYHAYSAKLAALCVYSAAAVMVATGRGGPLVWVALSAAAVCQLEKIVMTAVLPTWTYDVPTFVHALRLRRAATPIRPAAGD